MYFGTSPYDPELSELSFKAAKAFLQKAGDLRRLGSAALELCEVAQGKADIFLNCVCVHGITAGSLIVKEAGGFVCSPLEKKWIMEKFKHLGFKQSLLSRCPKIIKEAAFLIFEHQLFAEPYIYNSLMPLAKLIKAVCEMETANRHT